jgi:hypothetical protein
MFYPSLREVGVHAQFCPARKGHARIGLYLACTARDVDIIC